MGNLTRMFTGTTILVVFLLPALGCGGSSLTATQDQEESNNLMQALSALPTGYNTVEFTNWAFIKEYEEFQDVTSASNEEEWVEFFLAAAERHVVYSLYGRDNLRGHAKLWGWDLTDLDWEARVGPPLGHVLKFRDDFDFAPVLARYEERGFTASVYQGVTIYDAHELPLFPDWLVGSESSIRNTAVLTDENMLLMSMALDKVHDMLDAYHSRIASLADNPAVQASVSSLGEVGAAFIIADACSAASSEALLKDAWLGQKAQLRDRPQLQEYEAFGMGYRYEGTRPVGIIVMHFSDTNQARSDLQPRVQLATEGLVRGSDRRTYSEVVFTLNESTVKGSQIILEVTPVTNRPRLLFGMMRVWDMTFATCP